MGIFDRFGKKASNAGRDTIRQGNGSDDLSRFNGMISENNEKMKQRMLEIGERYCQLHLEDAEPALEELVGAVADLQAQNRELEDKIRDLQGLKKCPFCGKIIAKNIVYCDGCGERVLPEDVLICPNPKCGAFLPAGTLFCLKCGTPIVSETPPEPEQVQKCARCGAQLSEGAMFCTVCGEPVQVEKVETQPASLPRTCPACGTLVAEGNLFCPVCGRKIPGAVPAQTQPLTETTAMDGEITLKQTTPSVEQTAAPDYPQQERPQVNDLVNQIAEETVAICPRCGSVVELDSVFCSECGLRL